MDIINYIYIYLNINIRAYIYIIIYIYIGVCVCIKKGNTVSLSWGGTNRINQLR